MSTLAPILIVEDDPIDLDLTRRAFLRRNLPNPILVARDGEEALDWLPRWAAGERTPVLILLDLKLPRVSGLEVLRRLKEDDRARAIPVIMLTASSEDRDIDDAYALGVNSYLVKPVDFEKFHDVATQIDLYWCGLNRLPRAV